jgi:putative ABC transport system permease protein
VWKGEPPLKPSHPEREIDEELAYHVARRTEELRKEGLPAEEAERRARDEFGDLEATRRYCAGQDRRRLRSAALVSAVSALRDDVVQAGRSLARAPRSVLVPVLILAAGITLNALVFSVVRSVLLAPLPFHDADRVMTATEEGTGLGGASYPVLSAWRQRAAGVEAVAAYLRNESVLDAGSDPRHVPTALVTEGYFEMLDRPLILGRGFGSEAHAPGGVAGVLVSEGFWRGPLGGDPHVLERALSLDGTERPVRGVVRLGASFPDGVDLWLPAERESPQLTDVVGAKIFTTLVRARPGVGPNELEAELATLAASVPGGAHDVTVVRAPDRFLGDIRGPLLLLQAAVLLVLLTACANAGGLLLARATARRADQAVRTSLGAGSIRVARTVVAEGAFIGFGAGLAGLALARALLGPTLELVPPGLPRAGNVTLDAHVAMAALLLAVATGVGTALAPALSGMRVDPAALLSAARGQTGAAPWLRRLLDGFVIGQIGLAMLLTVGAALLLRSFVATVREEAGFDPSGVTLLEISLPEARYPDIASAHGLQRSLLDRASGLPGASASALAVNLPISGSNMVSPLVVEGSPEPTAAVQIAAVTSGFFDVLRIPVEGTPPDPEWDLENGRRMIMTDATLRTGTGRTLSLGDRAHSFFDLPQDGSTPMRDVVGTVAPVRHRGLREAPAAVAYEPFFQRSDVRGFSLLVRSTAPEGAVAEAARALVRDVDPALATDRITTMSAVIGRSVAAPRFYAVGLTVFGALAVLLALAGCHAGLAFRVTSRRRELGLRMALGASSPRLRTMVVRRGLTLAAVGASLGLVGAALASRVLESQLYDVSRTDPLTYGVLAIVVLGATAVAADGPARRAASMDPVTVLREE